MFTGKGGVGKTSLAAATGVIMRFAVQKYRESHLFMSLPQGQTLILPETVNAPKEH